MEKSGNGVDFGVITEEQQETWATGDFHEVARQNVCMAEALCEAVDPHATDRVLDVACGSGTAALVAARRYCAVTGIDYVPELIDRARARAVVSGLEVDFQVADAQDLPFEDDSFDFVLSVYGVQFAPDQERAAKEMVRVCEPGGKIGLATPAPIGWSADFFAVNAKYSPARPGVRPPLRWGTDEGLEELLAGDTRWIQNEERVALQYYRSVDHAVSVFLTSFGPAMRASQGVDEATQTEFREDLRRVFERYNRATDGTAVIENRYRLTVAACA
jgi:ubiquinone/menaquinone biosynthesis C-methylase UbiE